MLHCSCTISTDAHHQQDPHQRKPATVGAAKSRWPHRRYYQGLTKDVQLRRGFPPDVVTRATRSPTTLRAHRPRMESGNVVRPTRRGCQSPKPICRANQPHATNCGREPPQRAPPPVRQASKASRTSLHRATPAAGLAAVNGNHRFQNNHHHHHHHLARCEKTSHRD